MAGVEVANPNHAVRPAERATVAVFLVTAILTGASLGFPCVLRALMRTPRVLEGEVWRLVTALLVERGGAVEISGNLATLGLAGVAAERLWGTRRWLWIYFVSGVSGEIAGLAWKPVGAGSSVAMCGLLGACAVAVVRRGGFWTALTPLVVALGVLLTGLKNLHGPPLLVGAAVAAVFARRRMQPAR